MVEYREDDIELDPFEDRFEWFLNDGISRITCSTVEERNSVLHKLNARIGAINDVGVVGKKLILYRNTDQENIFVEDRLDPKDWSDVTWLIYRTDLEDEN